MDRALASGASRTGSTPVRGSFSEQLTAKDKMQKSVVAVIGGHDCSAKVASMARELGRGLVEVADVLVCGGLKGVMAAVCEGFKSKGGMTIGILPTYHKAHANPFVDIAIPTGLGLARNVLVVKTADVVVALPGKAGTLSEIAYCLQFCIPVIGLNSWDIPGVLKVRNVKEAVSGARNLLKKARKKCPYEIIFG